MKKVNAQIVWLALFSLLTAGIGQALLLTATATPSVPHLADAASSQPACLLPLLLRNLGAPSPAR